MIAAIVPFYVPKGGIVADVTFGRGVFWSKVMTNHFTLLKSDKFPFPGNGCKKMDFCALDFKQDSIDVIVLDPPYAHNPGNHMTDRRYQNAKTDKEWRRRMAATHGMYNRDIMELYRKGMTEAFRVLRKNGQAWVKCKDEIESGRQCWSHITLFNLAMEIGFYAKDLFVLVPNSKTAGNRWKTQHHARKTHSYLWIFQK